MYIIYIHIYRHMRSGKGVEGGMLCLFYFTGFRGRDVHNINMSEEVIRISGIYLSK